MKDGDTVVIAPIDGGLFFTCRLQGIDSPETPKKGRPGQPYGEEAAQALRNLILGETVTVVTTGAKTYRREVCRISKAAADINLEMIRKGYAWAYRQYLRRPYASEYLAAEREARASKLGLWTESDPTPPWEFRKRLRKR
ncbi:MAG: hypothetical protein OHK006_03420 [Thermodesulfovibrionales bacterium]